jgi:hypothetical protein
MTREKLEAKLAAKLAAIQAEQRRVSEFAGLRFGVFKRLRELERDERRVLRQIDRLPADPIAAAVEAELRPLADALIDAGHKLAKDSGEKGE